MTSWLLALGLCLTSAQAASPQARRALDARIADAVEALIPSVTELRHLEATRRIPVHVQDPDELRETVLHDALDDDAIAALTKARLAMRAFGLLPDDVDLQATITAVLSEQIGGFYDPDELRLVLVRRDGAFTHGDLTQGSKDAMIAAHELVHALQDQHFDLWRLRNRDFAFDDVDTAVLALVEGDASWAMLQLTMGARGNVVPEITDELFAAVIERSAKAPQQGSITKLPLVLRDALVFPYVQGLAFARRIERQGGWPDVDRAFANPPLSTEQVLHPEKYLAGEDPPLRLDLPDLAGLLGDPWHTVDENGFGELGIRSVLAQLGVDDALSGSAAAGWGGDTYAVLERTDHALAAVWASVWDTEHDADELAAALATIGTGWRVEVAGRRVTVLIGVPEAGADAVLTQVGAIVPTPITSLDQVSTVRPERRHAGGRAHSRAPIAPLR